MKSFSLLFFLAIAFIACREVQDAKAFKHPDEIVNPNGDSELALVMRNIHFEANKIGRAIESGEEVDLTLLKELSVRLSTSVPTDSNVLDEAYYSFTTLLESHVNRMDSEDATVEFNLMVKACVSCHNNTCPGPISKIKALKIKS